MKLIANGRVLRILPLIVSGFVIAVLLSGADIPCDPPPVLAVETFATGLDQPIFLGSAPNDRERVYVIERETARVIIFKNGVRLAKPFLNLADRVGSEQPEQGLLGLAFHPRYPTKRLVFVNYTDKNGNTVVERFKIR